MTTSRVCPGGTTCALRPVGIQVISLVFRLKLKWNVVRFYNIPNVRGFVGISELVFSFLILSFGWMFALLLSLESATFALIQYILRPVPERCALCLLQIYHAGFPEEYLRKGTTAVFLSFAIVFVHINFAPEANLSHMPFSQCCSLNSFSVFFRS